VAVDSCILSFARCKIEPIRKVIEVQLRNSDAQFEVLVYFMCRSLILIILMKYPH